MLTTGLILTLASSLACAEPERPIQVQNASIELHMDPADGTLFVRNRRNGKSWRQNPLGDPGLSVVARSVEEREVRVTWLHRDSGLRVEMYVRLEGELPEVVVTISSSGELRRPLRLPHPFSAGAGATLVVPLNEGISYPVDDATIPDGMRLVAYGGHGICMSFWGETEGDAGHMAIIETPDDAAISIRRLDGRLCVAPEWDPVKGTFGYARRLRYVFLEKGGHVAMCKRYRRHAEEAGLLRTLEEKRKVNPNVDLLVGAVNVWCWERDPVSFVREMKDLGIEHILWSHRDSPEVLGQLNELGYVLTSRYDIYQDLMDPEIAREKLRSVHPDWTQDGWPKDLMLDAAGRPRRGWEVRGTDGQMYPCGVLCDRQAIAHARRRIPKELETHPYRCRFIDTTTASPWRECYHPDHPMTRSESRRWKTELLRYISEDLHLVVGSETGHEAAAPYVHYFEGMLSLGPYRVPDAGRRMIEAWDEVPERVAKFQVGERYRLPLWELVFHDCVVAQWYWGDYNNKLPKLWDKRDLFNVLYGTPPMFMFNRSIWEKEKDRFARSYRTVCTVARAVGYAEMVDHRFLAPDRSVQETRFAGGVTVIVNFGEKPFRTSDGEEVPPMSHRVSGGPF